jgi:mono/diheme cytochrome c family protein
MIAQSQEAVMSLHRMLFLSIFCCFAAVILSSAQEKKPEVKHVPAPVTSAASGKEMFKTYCAPCHGENAKGDGPAAPALKSPPADLTALAKSNGGKYPADRVTSILRGQATVTAHGNKDMPVWGPVFWRMSGGHESEVQQRVANLTHYIETLQAK